MHDGRDAITPLLLDLTSKQHEFVTGRVAANLKPFVGAFSHDARCKWPEVLAVLDLLIKDATHVRPARVGKQRTVAKGSWPELHAALKTLNAGPRNGVELPRWGGLFRFAKCTTSAAPSVVPASCGADGMKTLEKTA